MARPALTLRPALLLRSALGGLAVAAMPAWALPGAPVNTAVNTGGGLPVLTSPNAQTLNVQLNAPRTVLQYNGGFAIGAVETVNFNFNARSDIAVVHALTGTVQIDGHLNSYAGGVLGGNVWLLSAAGVFFGPGARVDVGGLLASTSIPNNLLDPAGPVLTPTTLAFDFGNGSGTIDVATGAVLKGNGGTLALIAPSVRTRTGSQLTADGNTSVLYGAAQRYTVRFMQQAGNDLDLLDFEVPGLTAGTAAALPLQLAGATTAGNVYIASVSRADAVRAVLDASGGVEATTAGAEGGSIVLTSGGGIANRAAAPLLTGGAYVQDIHGTNFDADTGITATATGEIVLAGLATRGSASINAAGGDARVQSAATALDLSIVAANGLAQLGDGHVGRDFVLRGAQVSLGSLGPYSPGGSGYGYGYGYGVPPVPTRDVTIIATAGDFALDFDTPFHVGRDLTINVSGELDTGDLLVGRNLSLTGGSVFVLGTATAGGTAAVTALNGDMQIDTLNAVGDVLLAGSPLGLVDVGTVTTTGPGASGNGADVIVTGNSISVATVAAAGNFSIDATDTASFGFAGGGATAGGDVIVRAAAIDFVNVVAGRDVSLTAFSGGIAPGALGDTATVTSGRDVIVTSDEVLDAVSLTAVRDLVLTGGAGVDVGTATAGRDVIVTATSGDALVGSATAPRDLTIVADGGLASLGDGRVGHDLLMRGRSVYLGSLDGYTDNGGSGYGYGNGYGYGGNFTLTHDATLIATAGDISGGASLTVSNNILATATGAVTLGDLDAGNDVNATAGLGLTAGAITAGNDALLTAGGALTTGDIDAGRDIVASGGTLDVGGLSAGRDLLLTATAGSFSGTTLGAVRDLSVTAVGVTLDTATAGRDLTLASGTGTLGVGSATAGDDVRLSGATIALGQAQATGLGDDSEGDGANVTLAGGMITAGQLAAATDIGVTGTGPVSVGQATAGQDVSVSGGSVGGALQLSGRDVTVVSGSDFAASAGLVASRDLSLTAATTLSFASLTAARDLILSAANVAGGSAVATRDLTVTATSSISGNLFQAGRNLVLDPNEAISATTVRAGGDATLVGASITLGTLDVGGFTAAIATDGGLTIDTFTGQGATLIATGRVDLGDASGTTLRIVGGDLDVRRSLVASTLNVESFGDMVLGGTAAPGETGFRLAAADLARLHVSGIASFFAGTTTEIPQGGGGQPTPNGNLPVGQGAEAVSQGAGGNLIVQDFTYDPANLPRIALFADSSHVVDIQGIVAPSDVGAALQIGDADPQGRFRPASIYVSGGLGSAELVVNCFNKVVPFSSLSFYTVGDVILGDTGFRSAVQGTPAGSVDIFAGVPATPRRTDDRLFAVTTRFVIQANGKIVSQNTASETGGFVGVVLIGTGATGPIIDIGTTAAADLSGSIFDSGGIVRSGPLVARAAELGPGGQNGAIFRFNGCIVGGGMCTAGGQDPNTPATALRVEDYKPPRPIDLTDTPVSTVLVAEAVTGSASKLTVVNETNGIVIRSVTVLDAVTPDAPSKPLGQTLPGGCTVVPGSDGSRPDCPASGPH